MTQKDEKLVKMMESGDYEILRLGAILCVNEGQDFCRRNFPDRIGLNLPMINTKLFAIIKDSWLLYTGSQWTEYFTIERFLNEYTRDYQIKMYDEGGEMTFSKFKTKYNATLSKTN